MRLPTVLLLLMAAVICVPGMAQDAEEKPAQERTKEQAHHDAKLLTELYDKHNEAFEGIYGGVSVSETSIEGTLRLCEEHYAKIQTLEATVLPEIQPELARILELWGKTPAEEEAKSADFDGVQYALEQGSEIEWNMKMTASGDDAAAARDLPEEFSRVSTRFGDLARMLGNVEKTRKSNAEYLVDSVKNLYSPEMIAFHVEDIRVGKLKEAKTLLEWALKFDAGNEFANDRLATIDADIDALAKAIEDAIDARKWAGNADGTPGHVQAALEFFRNHPNWGKNEKATEVLAVCVRGDWVPGERDLFGRVISWGLPVHLAITKPEYKEKNRARVYELTVITQQGAPSPAKAPPFAGYWVGDSWYIRPSEVPSQ